MIYEYHCEKCDIQFESLKSLSERHYADCPKCGKKSKKIISMPSGFAYDIIRDTKGTPIWFPKDGKPYFDRGLRRTFHSKKEKATYMKKEGLVMDGSSNPKVWPVEAGDMRSRSYRRANKLED